MLGSLPRNLSPETTIVIGSSNATSSLPVSVRCVRPARLRIDLWEQNSQEEDPDSQERYYDVLSTIQPVEVHNPHDDELNLEQQRIIENLLCFLGSFQLDREELPRTKIDNISTGISFIILIIDSNIL